MSGKKRRHSGFKTNPRSPLSPAHSIASSGRSYTPRSGRVSPTASLKYLGSHLIDLDDDGEIDLEEFLASGGTKEDFAQFDVDGNGTLDPHEVHAYLKMREDSSHVAHVPKLGEWHKKGNEKHLISMSTYLSITFFIYVAVIIGCTLFAFWMYEDSGTLWSISRLEDLGLIAKADVSPTSELSTLGFKRYLALIVAITCVATGLGFEVIAGGWIVSHFSNQDGELLWHSAQMVFSLLLTIALLGQNAFALPFLVMGLWKFGFPETIGYLLKARSLPIHEPLSILSNYLNALGLLLSHSAGAYFVACITVELLALARISLAGVVILVAQQWFVPLKYVTHTGYNAVQFVLEVAFEWEVIAALPKMVPKNGVDATVRVCVIIMLVAHWMYLAAACIDIVFLNWFLLEGHTVDETGESFEDLRRGFADVDEVEVVLALPDKATRSKKSRALGPRTSQAAAAPGIDRHSKQTEPAFNPYDESTPLGLTQKNS